MSMVISATDTGVFLFEGNRLFILTLKNPMLFRCLEPGSVCRLST